MMDASYLVAFAIFAPLGFIAARIASRVRLDSESRRRARSIVRVDGAVDRYAQSDPDPVRVWPSELPGTRSHRNGNGNGPRFYLAEYRNAGRRAIPRDNNGPRPGRHALGRDLDFANAQAVGGYDLDGD